MDLLPRLRQRLIPARSERVEQHIESAPTNQKGVTSVPPLHVQARHAVHERCREVAQPQVRESDERLSHLSQLT